MIRGISTSTTPARGCPRTRSSPRTRPGSPRGATETRTRRTRHRRRPRTSSSRHRERVLEHFGADPAEYAVVFTPNATGACRLVGEAFPFRRGAAWCSADNHNSVNGIREFARARGAASVYVPLRPRPADRRRRTGRGAGAACAATAPRPVRATRRRATSPASGTRWPGSGSAQARGYDVLLDAAAYRADQPARPGRVKPEFVTVSWYKVFGYPTGVGCLIARREALSRLRRPWFSGGTIQAASVQGGWHQLAEDETRLRGRHAQLPVHPRRRHRPGPGSPTSACLIRRRARRCLTGRLLDGLAGCGTERRAAGPRLRPEDTTGAAAPWPSTCWTPPAA